MSRCYRIRQTVRVRDSLNRDVTAQDEICTELELLDILPPEQMRELLRAALRERGFEDGENGTMVRRGEGIEVRVDPASGQVTVRTETSEEVHVEGSKEVSVTGTPTQQHRKELREKLHEELVKRADQKSEDLQRKVSEQLEAVLDELGQEMERVVSDVTREALKQKAGQLGEIKELSEDPEAGSLTIKVEV